VLSGSAGAREQENSFPAYQLDGGDDRLLPLNDEKKQSYSRKQSGTFFPG